MRADFFRIAGVTAPFLLLSFPPFPSLSLSFLWKTTRIRRSNRPGYCWSWPCCWCWSSAYSRTPVRRLLDPRARRIAFQGSPRELAAWLPTQRAKSRAARKLRPLLLRLLLAPLLLLLFALTGEERLYRPPGRRHLLENDLFV